MEKGNRAFFDVRVFNPLAKSYSNQNIKSSHRRQELEKKRKYNERIINVEHGSFTLLIFTCFGGMGAESQLFYKRLANLISEKRAVEPSLVVNWIRTKLSFMLLRSSLLCLRGSRSRKVESESFSAIDIPVALYEAKIR